jgi:hypothetical protein
MEIEDPDKRLSRRQEKKLLEAAEAVARTEFDTPVRSACPGAGALRLLARRDPSLPDTPDLIDHIGTCSHCFNEYNRCRTAYKRRVRFSFVLSTGAVAAILSILLLAPLRWPFQRSIPSGTESARLREPGQPLRNVIVDLRMKGTLRGGGADQANQGPDPQLPRANLSIEIQLPFGSEEGVYDIAITSTTGQPLVQSTGVATLQNFIEVLPLKANLTRFSSGRYELQLRRVGTDWASYRVVVQ